jgi:prolyl-tRNA synthetase
MAALEARPVIKDLTAEEHRFRRQQVESPQSKPKKSQAPSSKSSLTSPKPASKKGRSGPALIGIDVQKYADFPSWYQQVLLKGDMIDYYDISGCYVLKPASWGIWESLSSWFDQKIKAMGVRNCTFPMFVSEDVLKTEKDHIEGFAAEVAWVTES